MAKLAKLVDKGAGSSRWLLLTKHLKGTTLAPESILKKGGTITMIKKLFISFALTLVSCSGVWAADIDLREVKSLNVIRAGMTGSDWDISDVRVRLIGDSQDHDRKPKKLAIDYIKSGHRISVEQEITSTVVGDDTTIYTAQKGAEPYDESRIKIEAQDHFWKVFYYYNQVGCNTYEAWIDLEGNPNDN